MFLAYFSISAVSSSWSAYICKCAKVRRKMRAKPEVYTNAPVLCAFPICSFIDVAENSTLIIICIFAGNKSCQGRT